MDFDLPTRREPAIGPHSGPLSVELSAAGVSPDDLCRNEESPRALGRFAAAPGRAVYEMFRASKRPVRTFVVNLHWFFKI